MIFCDVMLQSSEAGWQLDFENERLSNFLWFAGIVVGTLLIRKPLTRLITKISCYYADRLYGRKYSGYFIEQVSRPLEMLVVTGLLYVAVNQLSGVLNVVFFRRFKGRKLDYELRISDVTDKLATFFLVIFATLTVARIVDFVFKILLDKAVEARERDQQQLYPLIKEVAKITVWTIGTFWMLGSVFTVNIPALIAGLGIGGIAIALAAKESVENFFASFIIIADKPFRSGDNVRLGALDGIVERIGFRSTRLRNYDGCVFIIPNKKLIGENLENLSQRETRRIRLVYVIRYGVSETELAQMMDALKEMTQGTEPVQSPVTVTMENFTETAFQLIVTCYLPDTLSVHEVEDIKRVINLRAYGIIMQYTQALPPAQEVPAGDPMPEESVSISNPEQQEDDGSIKI